MIMLDKNSGKVDLHLHTNVSDGMHSPGSLIEKCFDCGLVAVAITDHETTLGFPEAKLAGEKFGVEVICGFEISVGYKGKELHLLGYMKEITSELDDKLRELRNGRYQRMENMIESLKKMKVSVSLEEIENEAGGAAPGRLHLARLLVKKKYTNTVKEAFDRFIGRDCPAYIPRLKLEAEKAIRMLEENNVLSFLAHPGITNEGQKSLSDLKEMGLKGIEVYHPEHSEKEMVFYKSVARKEGFLISGGSDYHGESKSSCQAPGCVSVPFELLEIIKARLNS